jgi:hypothetical protein
MHQILHVSSKQYWGCSVMSAKVVLHHDHGTGDLLQYANLTPRDDVMLDAITRKEYDLLNPYL